MDPNKNAIGQIKWHSETLQYPYLAIWGQLNASAYHLLHSGVPRETNNTLAYKSGCAEIRDYFILGAFALST